MKTIRIAAWLAPALLATGLAGTAVATDLATQTLRATPESAAGSVRVGIDARGTATAVWTEGRGAYYSTRPDGNFFGAAKELVQGGVGAIAFDEAPNGRAVLAVAGSMTEGRLLVFHRLSGSERFGDAQVVLRPGTAIPGEIDVAVSPSGRAVITFQLTEDGITSVKAALSDDAVDFGAPQVVDPGPSATAPRVDIDEQGNAAVVYDFLAAPNEIRVASAPAGSEFRPPTTIEVLERGPGEPDIAVNASGAAVVVYKDLLTPPECCSRDKVETRYGSVTGTFGDSQDISDVTVATGAENQEAAIDDGGRAAVVFSASIAGTHGIFASVSDPAGAFPDGEYQVLSHHPAVGGPDLSRDDFEIAAGVGEFTAYWSNDNDQDGTANEIWQSSTASAAFGSPHQLSSEGAVTTTGVHGARSTTGATIAGWVLGATTTKVQVAPVPEGTPPDYGTGADDDLNGSGGDDLYRLRGGDDVFNAGGGSDTVYGGTGDDTIAGGSGQDLLNGGGDADGLSGGTGNDTLKGGAGSDNLSGDGANSTSRRTAGNDEAMVALTDGRSDLLFGGAGPDRLKGGPGFDKLDGGRGKDLCIVDSRREKRRASSCETIKVRRGHL